MPPKRSNASHRLHWRAQQCQASVSNAKRASAMPSERQQCQASVSNATHHLHLRAQQCQASSTTPPTTFICGRSNAKRAQQRHPPPSFAGAAMPSERSEQCLGEARLWLAPHRQCRRYWLCGGADTKRIACRRYAIMVAPKSPRDYTLSPITPITPISPISLIHPLRTQIPKKPQKKEPHPVQLL